jgi:hypothetical protein
MKFLTGLLGRSKPEDVSPVSSPEAAAALGRRKAVMVTSVAALVIAGTIACVFFLSEQIIVKPQNGAAGEERRPALTALDRALIKAVIDDESAEVRRCLSGGAKAGAADELGRSPIKAAIALNRVSFIKEFIDDGYSDNAGKENSVLVYAVVQNRSQAVKELMRLPFDVNILDKNGYTPLMYDINRNYLEVVRELLKAGANVNKPDGNGIFPLIAAVTVGKPDLVAELLKAGACADSVSPSGETAMDIARKRSKQVMIALLSEAGAPVN